MQIFWSVFCLMYILNLKVMYGGDLKVDCVASGLPNPEIRWALPDGTMINTLKQTDSRARGGRTRRYLVFVEPHQLHTYRNMLLNHIIQYVHTICY